MSARLAWILCLFCLSIILYFNMSVEIPVAASRYRDVLLLLFAITLLRVTFKRMGLKKLLNHTLCVKTPRRNTLKIHAATTLLSWPLSIGSVPVMIDAVKNSAFNPLQVAALIMRSTTATTLIMPTTISAAVVYNAMPEFSLLHTILYGFPLFVVFTIMNSFVPIQYSEYKQYENGSKPMYEFILWFVILIVLIIGFSYFFKLNSLQSIAASSITIYFSYNIYSPGSKRSMYKEVASCFKSVSPEILLVLSCGLLAVIIEQLLVAVQLNIEIKSLVSSSGAIFIIIFILPIFCLIGFHPLIVFNLAFPLFSPVIASSSIQYITWIVMLISAQLISPVSINAIFAANCLGVSTLKTSFQMHIFYIVAISMITMVYLTSII